MGKTANVIGSTGLIGKQLIKQLIEDENFSKINSFVRRPSGLVSSKLEELIIDFDKPMDWENLVKGDVLFSTLGTTIKKAKTKANQYQIDFVYQFSFASIAAKNKIPNYVLISSAGANTKSSIFYTKMKGELEEEIKKLSFDHICILKPSILDGDREEQRLAEQISLKITRVLFKYIFKKYRPIKDEIVAKAMINSALTQTNSLSIYELDEIFDLAEK